MHRTDTNQKEKFASFCRLGLAIVALWLIVGSGWLSHAQSGRKEKQQSQADTTSSTNSGSAKDSKKDKELPTTFIVATASPDLRESVGPYAGYAQPPTSFEYHARGGCLVELKSIPGVKVIEDEDVERWEARQTALTEDKAWLIWMELRWYKTSSINSAPFRLRYLLFEPGTGKIIASGYGNGIRKTWGTDPRRTTLEEQVREAGRDIAFQVMSELKSDQ
jgi:hypothetical protein